MQSEHQFIHERCLGVIRKASMNIARWEWTILDSAHEALRSELNDGELPIVSFYAGSGDWTLCTTCRVILCVNGVWSEIKRSDFAVVDYGDFKQDVDSPRVTKAILRHTRGKTPVLYESGYASMAPIYYFRFWSHKWPVWSKTYDQIRNENGA